MRRVAACLVLSTAAIAACSPSENKGGAKAPSAANVASAVTGQPPKPKVGLWESSMTMKAGPAPMTVTSQMCIDEAMVAGDDWVKNQSANGGQTALPDCQVAVKTNLGGYTTDSTCTTPQGKIVTHAVATGDFQSAYTMDITSRMDPPPPGMPPGGSAENKMAVSARYVGPCPAGQKGGLVAGSVKMQPAG